MAKLTDFQGIMNKFKSAMDSVMGPSRTEATEDALSKESDPIKAKLLEIELSINQLEDLQIIHAKTLHELKSKYAEIHKFVNESLLKAESATAAVEANDTSENKKE